MWHPGRLGTREAPASRGLFSEEQRELVESKDVDGLQGVGKAKEGECAAVDSAAVWCRAWGGCITPRVECITHGVRA